MAADLSDPSYVAGVHARLWTLRRLALFGAVAAAVRALWHHVDHESAMRDSVRELAVEIRRQSSDLSELKRVASLSPLSALPTASAGAVQHPATSAVRASSPPSTGAAAATPPDELKSRSPVAPLPCALNEDHQGARARKSPARPARRVSAASATPVAGAQISSRHTSPSRAKSPVNCVARETRSSTKGRVCPPTV
jgi:hypothetical protein